MVSARRGKCGVIDIEETRRRGQSIFVEAGCMVYCSGESGGESQKKVKTELDYPRNKPSAPPGDDGI